MAVSIAVTSGKGGVGKTNTAVNLAISLQAWQTVVLFDADFGMANAHIMLGSNPKPLQVITLKAPPALSTP